MGEKMNQKGFVLPPLGIQTYALLGLALLCFMLGIALKVQTSRLDACKANMAVIKALGEQAEQEAKAKDEQNKLNKEKADRENAKLRDRLNATAVRLRNASANQSFLPPTPAGSRSPETACFARADLDAALRNFSRGFSELAIEGEQAVIDLDTAKEWAKSIH